MGAELFYVDGRRDRQTDMTEITVNFRDFAKELKNLDIFHFLNIDRKTKLSHLTSSLLISNSPFQIF